MNEQLQTQASKLLEIITSAVQKTGDFAVAQMPSVVQEYVAYQRVLSVLMLLLVLAFIALDAVLFVKASRIKPKDADDERAFAYIFAGCGSSILTLIVAASSAAWAVLPWVAPKYMILKTLAGFLK